MDEAFAAFTAFLIAALPLSVGVTKAVDTVRNVIDGDDSLPKVIWNLLAFVLGVAFCIGWGFNLAEPLIAAIPALEKSGLATGTAGEIVTGLAVGGMAGFWHEKMDEWSSTAKAANPTA